MNSPRCRIIIRPSPKSGRTPRRNWPRKSPQPRRRSPRSTRRKEASFFLLPSPFFLLHSALCTLHSALKKGGPVSRAALQPSTQQKEKQLRTPHLHIVLSASIQGTPEN